MKGADEVKDSDGNFIRPAIPESDMLGFRIIARPESGFVHYLPCEIQALRDLLAKARNPNAATLVDIRLRRVVRKNVFRIDKKTDETKTVNFKNTKPGNEIVK